MIKKILKLALASFLFLLLVIIVAGGGFGKADVRSVGNDEPLIFAHRGVPENDIVENTLEAFSQSKKYHFDAIETDLNITKDGKLIIFHDDSLKRLLHIDKALKDVEWKDIRNLYLYKNNKQTRQKIPSFEQFLQNISPETIVYLDVKNNKKIVADSLARILKKYPQFQNLMVADESILFLNYLRRKNKKIPLIWEQFNSGKEWLYYVIPKKFKPDYYASHLYRTDKKQIDFLKDNKLINNKIVYIINASNFQKTLDMGLRNMIVDYDKKMGSLDELKNIIKEKTAK